MNTRRTVAAIAVLAMALLPFLGSSAVGYSGSTQTEYDVNLPVTADSTIDYTETVRVIAGYFSSYYQSLEKLTVVPELGHYVVDTDDTHLYLCALQYGINWRQALEAGGIADSRVESVDVKYGRRLASGDIDIRAYVKIGFRYTEDRTATRTGFGDLWEVRLREVDGQLKIVGLDTDCSDYRFARDLVSANLQKHPGAVSGSYTKKDAIDDAYVVVNSRIDEFRALQKAPVPTSENADIDAEASCDERGGAALLSVSVPYSRSRAMLYANWKGYDYDTLIFKRMSPDCTNFASQCLWVGYGGDQGNNWYQNPGLATCRQLAYQNYRQIGGSSGWWGVSQISGNTYASGAWMRVIELYNYITSSSAGPRAYKYNNGHYYTDSSVTVQQGYILQYGSDGGSWHYYHSAVVVWAGSSGTTMSNARAIYQGQHSNDSGWRQMYEFMVTNSWYYARIIRPIAGSFNS